VLHITDLKRYKFFSCFKPENIYEEFVNGDMTVMYVHGLMENPIPYYVNSSVL
jgi:hypothetical protein